MNDNDSCEERGERIAKMAEIELRGDEVGAEGIGRINWMFPIRV